MATCARCGRWTQAGASSCLACSVIPSPPGPAAPATFVRPYVRLAAAPGARPALASAGPRTLDRGPAATLRPQAAVPPPQAGQPAVSVLPARRPAQPPPAELAAFPRRPAWQAGRRPPDGTQPDHEYPGTPDEGKVPLASPWLGSPPGGRWIALTAATAVVVIAAAGAILAAEQHDSVARPGGRTPAASARRTPAAARSSTPARQHAGLVAVAPAVASAPHLHAIVAFLTRYFTAINQHDYNAYRLLFSPPTRGGLTAAAFAAGYGTTRDSGAVLRRISATPSGHVAAAVTFTSHQRPADSPTRTSCTAWSISVYLVGSGGGYAIVPPPPGYLPSYLACSK